MIAGGYPRRTRKRLRTSRPARPFPSRNGWTCSNLACSLAKTSGRSAASTVRKAWASPTQSRTSIGTCGQSGGRIPRERLYVVLPEGAGALFRGCLRVRRHLPDGGHRKRMDLANLGEGDQLAAAPAIRLDPLPVDPAGRVGVAAHLEVFAQLFVAD